MLMSNCRRTFIFKTDQLIGAPTQPDYLCSTKPLSAMINFYVNMLLQFEDGMLQRTIYNYELYSVGPLQTSIWECSASFQIPKKIRLYKDKIRTNWELTLTTASKNLKITALKQFNCHYWKQLNILLTLTKYNPFFRF